MVPRQRGFDMLERKHSLVTVMNPIVSGTLAARHRAKLNPSYLMLSKKVQLSQLARLTLLALGFDDEMDWTTATSRKRRRPKKDDDEDEDYIVAPTPKPVSEDGVAKIMSTLLQAREQWVIIKLLTRLEVHSQRPRCLTAGE